MNKIKINFENNRKDLKGDILFVSVGPQNRDEVVKENGVKTLYLKSDEKVNLRKLFLLVRKMIAMAKGVKTEKIAFDFNDFKFPNLKIKDEELGEIIGSELDFANYEFWEYKTPPPEGFSEVKEVIIINTTKKIQNAILKGVVIAEEVNKTRSLSNTPGGDMTPQILASKAKEAVRGLPVKVTVLGEKEMEKQNMRPILSVFHGSY